MLSSPAPSSPDIACPPKQTRSSLTSKRRIATHRGVARDANNSWRPLTCEGKQRGIAAWQQQGAGLRAHEPASKKPRLSESPQKVQVSYRLLFMLQSDMLYHIGTDIMQEH